MAFGLHRTTPAQQLLGGYVDRRPGWRILVPLIPWKRRLYDIEIDECVCRFFVWSFGIAIEPIAPLCVGAGGFSLRVSWGWA